MLEARRVVDRQAFEFRLHAGAVINIEQHQPGLLRAAAQFALGDRMTKRCGRRLRLAVGKQDRRLFQFGRQVRTVDMNFTSPGGVAEHDRGAEVHRSRVCRLGGHHLARRAWRLRLDVLRGRRHRQAGRDHFRFDLIDLLGCLAGQFALRLCEIRGVRTGHRTVRCARRRAEPVLAPVGLFLATENRKHHRDVLTFDLPGDCDRV